ncbi:hypothetical protein ABZ471_44425 [Streptomyces sp. NPDC005728]|uniref:hypothetical protein n=1 Tax=Streptomyces sp. NPDC005728 TaxID=3157054 RepID=UPI0033E0189E
MSTWIVSMPIRSFDGALGHQHYVVEGVDADSALDEALWEAGSLVARLHRRDALLNVQDIVVAPARTDSLQPEITDLRHSLHSHATR